MTAEELQIGFKLELDKTDSQQYPNFEPEAIDYWLNKAQLELVKTRYNPNNIYRKGFEVSQKRIDDLRTIVKTVRITGGAITVDTLNPKVYRVDVPEDYLFLVRGQVTATNESCGSNLKGLYAVQHDDLSELVNDPFDGPNYDNPFICFEDEDILIYTDGTYTITNVYLTYIKDPVKIDINTDTTSELPVGIHDEIVSIAVNMVIENIESPRFQTNTIINKTIE